MLVQHGWTCKQLVAPEHVGVVERAAEEVLLSAGLGFKARECVFKGSDDFVGATRLGDHFVEHDDLAHRRETGLRMIHAPSRGEGFCPPWTSSVSVMIGGKWLL